MKNKLAVRILAMTLAVLIALGALGSGLCMILGI